MTTPYNPQDLEGRTAVDSSGARIGKIGTVYLDDQGGQPLWVTVSTGFFGAKESFAPLYGAQADGDSLRLAVTKDMVKDAPGVDPDGHISEDENDALYTYYDGYLGQGAQYAGTEDTGTQYAGAEGDATGQPAADTSGMAADDNVMTRSEERLHVGTEQVQAGRARLRK